VTVTPLKSFEREKVMVLLPKTRVAGPLYRRQQRFSDGSPIPGGEKVGPYVLRGKKVTYSQLHAALLLPIRDLSTS
jgi:hypothetical protein